MNALELTECGGPARHRAVRNDPGRTQAWRKLDGQNQLPKVIEGIKFTDGISPNTIVYEEKKQPLIVSMQMEEECRPVIVYGADTTIGLPILRDLGMHGVPIIALQRHRHGLGRFSRHTIAWEQIESAPEDRIAQLERMTAEHSAQFIIASSEDLFAFVRQAADAGKLSATVLGPSKAAFDASVDKFTAEKAAREVGLPTPLTWQISALSDLEAPPAGFRFPCILKWRNSNLVWHQLKEHGLSFTKSEFIRDEASLRSSLSRYEGLGAFPMIQTFAIGVYLGINVLMVKGKAVLIQQEKEIAMWPPEQGIDCVVEAVPPTEHREIRSKVEKMMAALDYEGPACVEFRWDPDRHEAVWIEINPRFWGSQPLARHCGLHFGWWLHQALGLGRALPQPADRRDDIIARFLIPETRRLIGIIRNDPQGGYWTDVAPRPSPMRELARYLWRFIDPRVRYYVWSWGDPLPCLADLSYVAMKAARMMSSTIGARLGRLTRQAQTSS